MTTMTPYSGSLLRLALTTVAILAAVAAGFSLWQGTMAGHAHDSQQSTQALAATRP